MNKKERKTLKECQELIKKAKKICKRSLKNQRRL